MKLLLKYFFAITMLIFSSCKTTQVATQKKDNKDTKDNKNNKEEIAEIKISEEVGDEVVMEEIAVDVEVPVTQNYTESPVFDPVSNIRFNDKYEVYTNINEQYDFYWPKYSKNKYSSLGVVDKSGNVVLPHLFNKSYGSANTYEILLNMNTNFGLFNLNENRWTIPMEYEGLTSLGSNLFSAKKNGKWGVVDNNNVTIAPFEWSQINSISNLENYIIVSSSKTGNQLRGVYSLVERKLTIPLIYSELTKLDKQSYFQVSNNSKVNVVDINNVPRFKKWYDEIRVPSIGRNYYVVKLNGRYGILNDSEKEVVPIEYMEFGNYPFSDGSYLARNKEGKYGFILIDGRVTLPFEYDNLKKTYNDNVVSVQNGKCGLVQVNAGVPYEILTCDYDDIKGGGKTFIVEKAGKFALLDLYGKLITQFEYESLEALGENSSYDEVIFKAKKGTNYLLINEQGKQIGMNTFTNISPLLKNSNTYYYGTKYTYLKAQVKNGKYGIIDKVGKEITKPIFDDVIAENNNIFIVKLKDKHGLFSLLDQKLLVDYEYDQIVKSNDNYFGITGKKIDFLILKSNQVSKVSTTK